MILPREQRATRQHYRSRNEFAVVISAADAGQLVSVANQLAGQIIEAYHSETFWGETHSNLSPFREISVEEITTIIIPLRKSLTVIYHHSLHHKFFPQLPLGVAFYLLIGFWFM